MSDSPGEIPLHQMSGAEESDEGRELWIPGALARRIQRRLPSSDFNTIDDYVAYVLDQVLTELEAGDAKDERKSENQDASAFSKEDQEIVEQRLRDLGYM